MNPEDPDSADTADDKDEECEGLRRITHVWTAII
jgi:hypothetical protein